MAKNKKVITSHYISETLGNHSEIFSEAIEFLKKQSEDQKSYKRSYLQWKEKFANIYGSGIKSDLFLKHTYFTLILKIILISKLISSENLKIDEVYSIYLTEDLKKLNIFKYSYFFWTNFNKEIFEKVYHAIHPSYYEKEDIFSEIYQEMFLSEIRHKIGEFYTPSILIQKMIEEVYKIGLKTLDPSCGSGNFIINVLLKILNSSDNLVSKFKALSRVYGFDINPLAIMTTKMNMLLMISNYFNIRDDKTPKLNIYLLDSLFPELIEEGNIYEIKNMRNSFDLIIGNPPWLTYKDLNVKEYQIKIRELSENLGIKPPSQYITHIELAAIFFYAIPLKFLKKEATVFFVMPRSVINGDHCHKFRAFSIFNKNLEIWDFPNHYFFNVNHICLKAEFIGQNNDILIDDRYPIKTKLFNDNLELREEKFYSSLKIEKNGAKLLLPIEKLKSINNLENSPYKDKFFQGATLVPRTLIFFEKNQKKNDYLIVSSDSDVLSRAKAQWKFNFKEKEIEQRFQFKTFLNLDLIPFFIKRKRNVFLPINEQFDFNLDFLQNYPKAFKFYEEMNNFYEKNKKKTSRINTLFANLNYWNKLKKQIKNKSYIVVYNASGSNLKAAVINNDKKRIVIGSENYYFSTNTENEAYYLSAILNDPNLSKNIKLIKSSRHIHKRPFMFPIPPYDENNILHEKLARTGKKCELLVYDLVMNNPKITSEKVKLILNQKLMKIQKLTEQVFLK